MAELSAFWNLNQRAHQALWDRQEKATADAEVARILAEKASADAAESLLAQEKIDADKKKAKISDFTEGSAVPDDI